MRAWAVRCLRRDRVNDNARITTHGIEHGIQPDRRLDRKPTWTPEVADLRSGDPRRCPWTETTLVAVNRWNQPRRVQYSGDLDVYTGRWPIYCRLRKPVTATPAVRSSRQGRSQ